MDERIFAIDASMYVAKKKPCLSSPPREKDFEFGDRINATPEPLVLVNRGLFDDGSRRHSSQLSSNSRPVSQNRLMVLLKIPLIDLMSSSWQTEIGENPEFCGDRFIDIPMRGDIIALSFSGDIDQQQPLRSSYFTWFLAAL